MKRIIQVIATVVVGLGLSTAVAAAATDPSCSINFTGPGSNNSCNMTSDNNFTFTCTNDVDVVTINGQSAKSGSVNVTGNTDSGFAASGQAVNYNQETNTLDLGCAPAQVASTVTPAAGGQGAVAAPAAPAAKAAAPAPKVVTLPETGSNSASVVAGTGVAAIAVALVASRFGLIAYRRHALK